MTAAKRERNEEIVAARRTGRTLRSLADQHGISVQRVRNILQVAEAKANRRRCAAVQALLPEGHTAQVVHDIIKVGDGIASAGTSHIEVVDSATGEARPLTPSESDAAAATEAHPGLHTDPGG